MINYLDGKLLRIENHFLNKTMGQGLTWKPYFYTLNNNKIRYMFASKDISMYILPFNLLLNCFIMIGYIIFVLHHTMESKECC